MSISRKIVCYLRQWRNGFRYFPSPVSHPESKPERLSHEVSSSINERIRQLRIDVTNEPVSQEISSRDTSVSNAKERNVAVLQSLNFRDSDIHRVLSKKSFSKDYKANEILLAAEKLNSLGISDVSKLGNGFINAVDSIVQGKSDAILNYLASKYPPQILEEMLGGCNPWHWGVEELEDKICILEAFGVVVNHKYLFNKYGPMSVGTTKIKDRFSHLINLVGKEHARTAVQRNFKVLGIPKETVSRAFEYMKFHFGEESAKQIVVRVPSVCASNPKKTEEIISQLTEHFTKEEVLSFLLRYPVLFYTKPENVSTSLKDLTALFGKKESISLIRRCPQFLIGNSSKREILIYELSKIFGEENMLQMLRRCPTLMGSDWKRNVSKTLYYLLDEMGREKVEILKNPTVLVYSLNNRLKPRFKRLEEEGIDHFSVGLGPLTSFPNSKFEELIAKKKALNNVQ